jgi:predicted dehydrogenase/threonine dehydrogenase-like Zn-dependent dehydrogenase
VKQVLQSLRTGATEVADVPCPAPRSGELLIRSRRTLVSVGTERMLVEFGRAGWVEKARQQPDKVRMALDKIGTDGLLPTVEAVFNKLDEPVPLGYCNVGTVVQCGPGVTGFATGDRVVSNGRHAEIVSVPVNLCARVPDEVTDDAAAFTVLGSIALHGIRLAQLTLGEAVVVTGVGLIGLLTVQLLRAQGCRVLGLDFDAGKLALARRFGAEVADLSAGHDPISAAQRFSRARGVDAVIVTAATTSSEPMRQAAQMCRKRGRIILVGVAGLELSRSDFYEKELTFQVSCSYGPGRYDPNYEERGIDYPIGFVRWTEQRNFEAVLDMLAAGRLDVMPLVSHRFPIAEANRAYDLVGGSGPSLGIVIEYPGIDITIAARTVRLRPPASRAPESAKEGAPAVSFIGSGHYATSTLIPAFRAAGATLRCVASGTGVTGLHAGLKFGFEETTTDVDRIFEDPAVAAVVIATRHDSHADLVCRALSARKHVYVEKPLALTLNQLSAVEQAFEAASAGGVPPILMIGFNRRFAPQVVKMKSLLDGTTGPKALIVTVNAGMIPAEHWTQIGTVGGGRIIGEACHFVDLLRFLAASEIASVECTARMGSPTSDTISTSLRFADGSVGTIHYFANGSKSFPKERVEVFADGRVLQLDNYRKLTGFGWPRFRAMNLWRQDKGHQDCAAAFITATRAPGPAPIPAEEIFEVSHRTIEIATTLGRG